MKLLIVDDEELTRNGLVASLPWETLGITEVFQANDGINGLACALKNKPEIILCDVRMPRMDGIQMVENIQEMLPNTATIFMSGYSDKEYLKAAIKLKAVNYVEKPLNLTEIKEAVLEAIANFNQKQQTLRGETWHYQETSSKLALQLTLPREKDDPSIKELYKSLSLESMENAYYLSFIIKIPGENPFDDEIYQVFSLNLNQFLETYKCSSLMAKKHQNHIIFFLFSSSALSSKALEDISSFFRIEISKYGKAFICRGNTVHHINNAYQSYETAVILMQSSFFFDMNKVLSPEILAKHHSLESDASLSTRDYTADFLDALASKNKEKIDDILSHLFSLFYESTEIFSDHARDLYYKLFTTLQDMHRKMKILNTEDSLDKSETVISYLEQFYSFKMLHEALVSKVNQYFSSLDHQVEENSTVYLIKEYIRTHYKHENLSVKDISEHVYLSASYVCTLFKTETGQTLNQYITEYRMEKAKKLLTDPRYKITDISAKVGYSDGNYFGKSFKKAVGLSPSEYREKMSK